MLTRTLAGLAVLTALVAAPAVRAGDASSDRILAAGGKSAHVTAAQTPPAPAPQLACSCSHGKA
ncbi:MAG TPA: hypothetical protein VFE30_00090 [Anaeromyxobacteraceae bacterium]|nr:hypothetical protein [Anaeromyxobacteraceae bacterium]